jgi:outer membrane biosynthesis protein TonB
MNQVDKERLAVSSGLSLLLYAGLFAISAWLDLLAPPEPREYFGPIALEVSLLPEPEPQKILPPEELVAERPVPEPEPILEPEPTPEPVAEPTPEPVAEPTPEPVVEPTPEPVAEPTPEPVVEPTPEPVAEPTPEPVAEPTPEPVAEPTPEPVAEPTPEPVAEPTPEPVAEPTPEPVAEPTPEPVAEPTPEPVAEPAPTFPSDTLESIAQPAPAAVPEPEGTPQEAVVAETPINWASEDQVSAPPTVDGTDAFHALRPDAPTDQFGSDEIKYGDVEPVDDPDAVDDHGTTDGAKPFLDLGGLDSLPASGQPEPSGGVDSQAGTDGNENGGSADRIVAESLTQLKAQRQLVSGDDPDMEGLRLPNGLPSMVVWVEFVIQRTGLVSRVTVDDTGDSTLNSTIEAALRKWKFAPIVANRLAIARLKYVITATD